MNYTTAQLNDNNYYQTKFKIIHESLLENKERDCGNQIDCGNKSTLEKGASRRKIEEKGDL